MIHFRDRGTGAYPISLAELRARVDVLFGDEASAEVLDAGGVDPVAEVPAPDAGDGFEVVEGAPELGADGWRQTWQVRPIVVPVPVSVTMRQAKLALSRAILLGRANSAIGAMPGQAGEEARIEWEYATTLRRDHPLVSGLGQALGLSAADIDALFVTAAAIG